MPPPRSSDVPQRPAGVRQLRTSSLEFDRSFHRPITDRSLKLGDRRSPTGSQSALVTQQKLGTRIAGLESQLGQAQEELKILKKQMASTGTAKNGAQYKPEKTSRMKPGVSELKSVEEKDSQHSNETQPSIRLNTLILDNVLDDSSQGMDVFEVPLEKKTPSESTDKQTQQDEHGEEEDAKLVNSATILGPSLVVENLSLEELARKTEEISLLKVKLEDKEKELQECTEIIEELKKQLSEALGKVSSTRVKEEELESKVLQLSRELEVSKEKTAKLCKKLEVTEGLKESLEMEMTKLRVQTEQWRKAADAASAVLAEENGRSMSFNGLFEAPFGLYDESGSPGFADDMNSGGKKKGSGIKMLGDLWKKKGHK
uniref:Uncharacterized protein n=1 Tax=Kalanchoe fedtschenkoi TaxID=63787 RepID=A0A7N0RC05_KALFE